MASGKENALTSYYASKLVNTWTKWGILYANTTSSLTTTGAGTAGYLLQSNASSAPSWIQATNTNVANTIVKRDASGNFTANEITATKVTASIIGNCSGTAGSVAWTNVTGRPGNVTRTNNGLMLATDKVKLDDMEVIIGTQTSKTGAWTGNASHITALYDGLTIKYYLPRDPSGNATLNLKLADGTQTGAINCYYNSGRLTTHYAVGSVITLTYYSAGSITVNGTATTDNRWIADANYDSGNTNTVGYLIRYNNGTFTTTTALNRYKLLLQVNETSFVPISITNDTATTKADVTSAQFLIFGDYCYYTTNGSKAANAAIPVGEAWLQYPLNLSYSLNTGTTLTAHKDVYLVAVPAADGIHATLRNPAATGANAAATATGDNAGPITQALPNSDDGFIYIRLGHAYSTSEITLTCNHPVYWYKDGAVRRFRDWRTLPVAVGGTGVTTTDDIFATYGVEYIVGTQTGETGAWTGNTKSASLYVGKTIAYKLPFKGSGNATLELTLADGTTKTGAKAVYAGNTRLTTHYPANSIMIMVWNGTDWRTNPYYDTNTNTLLRTYASSTNIEVPLIAQSSANNVTAAWTSYTGTYKDWYGAIPNTDSLRAKINLSTGAVTVPGGITTTSLKIKDSGAVEVGSLTSTLGTSSAEGWSTLTLGNNKDSTTANNASGKIILYSKEGLGLSILTGYGKTYNNYSDDSYIQTYGTFVTSRMVIFGGDHGGTGVIQLSSGSSNGGTIEGRGLLELGNNLQLGTEDNATGEVKLYNSNGTAISLTGKYQNSTNVLEVGGNLSVGCSSASNYIMFYGLSGDSAGIPGNHDYIGNRIWGSSESSELVLFKGNDVGNTGSATTIYGSGPDRIRHIAAAHIWQTYTSALSGTFEAVCTSNALKTVFEVNTNKNYSYVPLYLSHTGIDNTAFRNALIVYANQTTESAFEAFDASAASWGISFHRDWNTSSIGTDSEAGIYAVGSQGWRTGLVFRTKNTGTQGGAHDTTALWLSPAGRVGVTTPTTDAANLTIGSRGTTTAPTSLTTAHRISITPYYHTGGPWRISSTDDSTNAYLSLFYGDSARVLMQHTGLTLLYAGNMWLTSATLQLTRPDTSQYGDRACIGVTNGNLHLDAYSGYTIYLNYYCPAGSIYFGNAGYQIYNNGANYNGTAAAASWAAGLNNSGTAGPYIRLPAGHSTFAFLTAESGAVYADMGRLGLADSYASIDLTNYRLDCYGGSMRIYTGCLNIFPASIAANWNEGIRIHPSDGGWTTIMLCGSENTGNGGTSANSWSIHTYGGQFFLTKHGSSSHDSMDGQRITGTGAYWDLYCSGLRVIHRNNSGNYAPVQASAYGTISSRYIKENIQDLTEEEAKKILLTRPVSFDFIKKYGGQKEQRGLIAEEVQKIIPSVIVSDNSDSNDMNIKPFLGIDYAKFTPYLIKLAQIQQKEIDSLKSELSELRSQISK